MRKTKREMFNLIATVNADNTEIVEFCKHEIDLLDNKKGTSKPTKTQRENEDIKVKILDVLVETGEPMTVGEILEVIDGKYSSQKITALLRQLMSTGKVEKTVEKKVSRFALV